MARLTQARQNLWAAIDATPTVKSRLVRTYRFDATDPANDPTGPLQPFPPRPSVGATPALALYPTTGTSPWNLNRSQRLGYSLQATLWTPHWNLPLAEDLWEQIVLCWWKTRNPVTNLEFWRGDPSGGHGVWYMDVANFTFQPWKVEPSNPDSPWATRLDWTVTLTQNWNPRT